MPVKLDLTITIPKMKGFDKSKTKDFLALYGQHIVATIDERNLKGKDLNNEPYKRYTPEYAKYKRRTRGRKLKGNWLQLTGAMMNSLQQVELTNKRVVVGFVGASISELPSFKKKKRKKKPTKKQGNTQIVQGASWHNVIDTPKQNQKTYCSR